MTSLARSTPHAVTAVKNGAAGGLNARYYDLSEEKSLAQGAVEAVLDTAINSAMARTGAALAGALGVEAGPGDLVIVGLGFTAGSLASVPVQDVVNSNLIEPMFNVW